jgi:hypothetical protein
MRPRLGRERARLTALYSGLLMGLAASEGVGKFGQPRFGLGHGLVQAP